MFLRIKKFFDIFHNACYVSKWGHGRWFVEYKDGKRSKTTNYSTAHYYAGIFGGKVRHISELKT